MSPADPRTPTESFMREARSLEAAYLSTDDPIEQSGFGGGPDRWQAERSPLIGAIERNGSFLDVGCANGRLAADVVRWAAVAGFEIEPHGIDLGARLIALARLQLPEWASNFRVADAWTWRPDRAWTYVYSLLDLSPPDLLAGWLGRLHEWVEPGGRLVIASYGSVSRRLPPANPAMALTDAGLTVGGTATGGTPPVTAFAWTAIKARPHR